jgi:putative oxidoreductase
MSVNKLDVSASATGPIARAEQLYGKLVAAFARIPHSAIACLARLGIGLTFWTSGQTKIEGLVLDPIGWNIELGVPRVSEGAIELFRSEYALPVIPPELAAQLAATAEHVFPLLLLLGLATRLSAFALLLMTLVIQIFVYPSAYPTHALWASVLIYLMARGPGVVSLDRLIAGRRLN